METTFEVHIPTPLLGYGFNRDKIQQRINEWLVFSLFTEGRVSSGKAARLLNVSRVEFLKLLQTRGISYVDYTPEELEEEFLAAEALQVKTKR